MPRADDIALRQREGRYTCETCQATFNKSEHYKRHIRSHTLEKPYECSYCGRSFSRQDSLKRHGKLHNGEEATADRSNQSIQEPTPESASGSIPLASPSASVSNAHVSPALVFGPLAPMPTFGHLDLLADASARASPPQPEASTSAIPIDPTLANGADSYTSNNVDAKLFEAWLNPSHPSVEVSSLFGSDWDADGAAYLNTIFGATTTGVFSRAGSPPIEAGDPEAPLLPLNSGNAVAVSKGWKLKHVSSTPFRPDTPLPPVFNTKQSANALSSELKLPKDEGTNIDPIPSLDFVDLAIAQYFSRFHPAFPILHRPTFSRMTVSPLLLLSVLSVGAVYLNTPDAKVRAHLIFERLNKLVLATWVTQVRTSATACIVMAHVATLGQSYAMLHGDMNCLLIWHAYHGTVISWARYVGLFQTGPEDPAFLSNARTLVGGELDAAWRAWADREKARRAGLGLVIHENELAARACLTPTAWHVGLPLPCSDALFEAPTPEAWRAVLINDLDGYPDRPLLSSPISTSYFQLSIALAELRIEAAALQALSMPASGTIQSRLATYYDDAERLAASTRPQTRGLGSSILALWHATAFSFHVDMDLLERSAGREGPVSPAVAEQVTAWALSEQGRRAAVHAARALHHASALGGLLHESGLHAVRVAFQAAIALFTFTALAPRSSEEEAIDLVNCDIEAYVRDGAGKKVVVAGFVDGQGTRRLDAMSLLLTSANLCTRATSFGVGAAFGETLNALASDGL